MRIYTRGGDKGKTSLVHGKRVPKNDIRVEAYGTCDEANSVIGLALSHLAAVDFEDKAAFTAFFSKVQTVLFHVGAELATPAGKEVYWQVTEAHIKELEEEIDKLNETLPELKQFILPGGHPAAAGLHHARTVTRRAERLSVALADEVSPLALAYLNRCSDFLFVAARYVNRKTGTDEPVLHGDV